MTCQLVVSVIGNITVIAGVRARPCVPTFMIVLVSDRSKFFGAKRALIRFLTGMGPVMDDKVAALSESLLAVSPITLEDTGNDERSIGLVEYRRQVGLKFAVGSEGLFYINRTNNLAHIFHNLARICREETHLVFLDQVKFRQKICRSLNTRNFRSVF